MGFEAQLKKYIKSISHPLKEGKDLELALRARLTKKEFKLLKAWVDNDIENFKSRLNLTQEDYENLRTKLIKKLNSEKTKQSLYNFNKLNSS